MGGSDVSSIHSGCGAIVDAVAGKQGQGVPLALGTSPIVDPVDLDADRALGPRPRVDLVVAPTGQGTYPHVLQGLRAVRARSLRGTAVHVWEASAQDARVVCSGGAEAEFAEGPVHRVMHLAGRQGSHLEDAQLRIAVGEMGVCLVDPVQV